MGRVLVVDDDQTIRTLLEAHLKQIGHRVLLTASAEEALAAVDHHGAPDVAVLDVRLPDVDGFELAEKLRAATGREKLPIIFLSANVDQMHIDRGREIGAAYLTKPYIRTALRNAIDKALVEHEGW
jgi:DNA-binding response OmpR family regulator